MDKDKDNDYNITPMELVTLRNAVISRIQRYRSWGLTTLLATSVEFQVTLDVLDPDNPRRCISRWRAYEYFNQAIDMVERLQHGDPGGI